MMRLRLDGLAPFEVFQERLSPLKGFAEFLAGLPSILAEFWNHDCSLVPKWSHFLATPYFTVHFSVFIFSYNDQVIVAEVLR